MTNPELSAADKVKKVNSLLRAAGAFGGIDYGEVAELTQFVSGLPAEVERLKGELLSQQERIAGYVLEFQNQRTEIARLQGELDEARSEVAELSERLHQTVSIADERNRLRGDLSAKQAQIDSLMFEYCPDEMTPEQVEKWGKRQRRCSPEEEAAINAAIKDQQP